MSTKIAVVFLIVGLIAGWEIHKMYLRGLVKTMRKIKKKLVGR